MACYPHQSETDDVSIGFSTKTCGNWLSAWFDSLIKEFWVRWRLVYLTLKESLYGFLSSFQSHQPHLPLLLNKLSGSWKTSSLVVSLSIPTLWTSWQLLRCFHVFCKQCLERLVVHDFQGLLLLCPSCGHPHFFLLPFCRGKMINKLSHPSHSAGSCWLAWQKMATIATNFWGFFFEVLPHESATRPFQGLHTSSKGQTPLLISVAATRKCKQPNEY